MLAVFVAVIIGLLLLLLIAVPAWLMWFAAESLFSQSYTLPAIRMTLITMVLSIISAATMDETLSVAPTERLLTLLTYSIIWSALLIPISALSLFLLRKKTNDN
jgi:uncharacterized membrane protein YkvI